MLAVLDNSVSTISPLLISTRKRIVSLSATREIVRRGTHGLQLLKLYWLL